MKKRNRSVDMKDAYRSCGLSPKFWQLAEALAMGWDMMNQLLEQEWRILRGRKTTPLWHIGRQKEKLAGQLMAIEKRIDMEIPGFDPVRTDARMRWAALLKAAASSERARLTTWRTGLALSKRQAFMTNRRLYIWITEKQELNQRLTAILSGRGRRGCMTYTENGTYASQTSGTEGGISTHDRPASGSDHFFAGFSQERINQAMEAYRMNDSKTERPETWD